MVLNNMKRFIISILSIISVIRLNAQHDSTSMEQYSPSFSFNDGFFLNFDQVKSNAAIPNSKIVTTADYNSADFFDVVIAGKKLIYFDNLGLKHEEGIDKIWGYSRNGVLYINVNGTFNRINIIGSICHFIATFRSHQPSYYDPFMYGPGFGGLGSGFPANSSGYETTEVKQLILDFETGKLYEYTLESLEFIFSRDPDLYTEFSALKKKKKKQLKFVYLRKYNEKHPLFFPVKNE